VDAWNNQKKGRALEGKDGTTDTEKKLTDIGLSLKARSGHIVFSRGRKKTTLERATFTSAPVELG